MGRPPQAPAGQTKGLVLTAGGVARPPIKKRRKPSAHQGWPQIMRKGWTPHGRDYRLGSRQPDPAQAGSANQCFIETPVSHCPVSRIYQRKQIHRAQVKALLWLKSLDVPPRNFRRCGQPAAGSYDYALAPYPCPP